MKKKSVTKILLSVMVLLVSVAFCACGSNKSTESSETGNSSSEKTTESAADGTQSDRSQFRYFLFHSRSVTGNQQS